MIKTLRVIFRKTRELWNVYGGIALSTFIAWLTRWNKVQMDTWASYLILTLTCISVLTFLKIVFTKTKKKKTNFIDKGALQSQKSLKTLKTALDPMQVGEEVGTAIIYTVKGGKKFVKKLGNFFKELWGNKFTISNTLIILFFATLSQVATFTEYLYRFTWFAEHEMIVKIASPIIAGVWVFIDLLTTYTKYGFESLEEIAKRKEEKKLATLSKEEKVRLKANLKNFKNSLDIAKEKKKELYTLISNYEALVGSGYAPSPIEREVYTSNQNQIVNIDNTIKNLENKIQEIEEKL